MMDTNSEPLERLLELEPPELAARLQSMDPHDGARLFQALIEEEQRLSLLNLLKPYRDKVPLVLDRLEVPDIVRVFDHMDDYYIMKALFGNFRVVEEKTRQEILARLRQEKVAALLQRMSIGIDNPKLAAKVLSQLPLDVRCGVAGRTATAAMVRVFAEMGTDAQASILGAVRTDEAVEVVHHMLGRANAVRTARVARVLRRMRADPRRAILAQLEATPRASLQEELGRQYRSPLMEMEMKEAKGVIEGLAASEAARRLREVDAAQQTDILRACEAKTAAAILTLLARQDHGLVADILEAINTKIIVDFKRREGTLQPVEEMYMCPAAGILEALDLSQPENLKVLQALAQTELEAILEKMRGEKRAEIQALLAERGLQAELPVSMQLFAMGRGTRRTVRLEHGLKWTRVEEVLDTGVKQKPVLIDLLEMDPARVTIQACRAITEENAVPITEVARIFGQASRDGKRPDKAIFTRLGLIQLSRVAQQVGAIAAINGNHYFDYGHYMDVTKLGIDPTQSPGLFFGDPVGWFVTDGQEVSPPAFNRAAFVVTEDGRCHLEKVFMTNVTLSNGVTVEWEGMNCPREVGKIILYNSLYGFQTPPGNSHLDVAIAGGRIFDIAKGGEAMMPFTGFVLSIPVERQEAILTGVRVGDPVTIGNNFPAHLGKVEQAMACGPHLVRDGQLDISFQAEDFGEKDSSVMSFSLTRAVETFEAARSFMMLKGGKLIIGTVSGTRLGTGAPAESGGMTFGELAQLCLDLGADHAYALDGGGSSSLVAKMGEEMMVLNIPTGGSDVPKGEERFINTYWLFFAK